MKELLLRGKKIGKIKGILFDKDGTLINSEKRLLLLSKSRIEEAIKIFEKENYSNKDIDNLEVLLSKAYGMNVNGINPNGSLAIASKSDNLITTATILSIFGKTWPNALDDAKNIFESARRKVDVLNEHRGEEILLPGVTNFLKSCYEKEIKLAIISNDNNLGIRFFLNEQKIKEFFPVFWSSEHYPPKPNPDSVRKLCQLINIKPHECALISDSNTDMKMACQSNVSIVLGFTGGWQKPPLIYEHHHLINHWNELTFQ